MSAHQSEFEDRVSISINNDEEILYSGSDCGEFNSAVSGQFRVFTGNGLVRLEDESAEHEMIKKTLVGSMHFATGMKTDVVAIHKNVPSDGTRKARHDAFQIFRKSVAERRSGDANVQFAWCGGSKDDLCQILVNGFNRCSELRTRAGQSCGGVGIHLFHGSRAHLGASISTVDEFGLKHILMCRVIVGKTEAVAPGAKQYYPSSANVDIGVDNPINPSRFIVWGAFMNSHIYPDYVISFKTTSPPMNVVSSSQPRQALRPGLRQMSIPALMSMLSVLLTRPQMQLLNKFYNAMMANKITRQQMIQKVKQIAGTRLLFEVFQRVNNQMGLSAKTDV